MTAVPAAAAPGGLPATQQIQPVKKVDPRDYPGGRYIVVLNEEPAATYEGGVPGIAATKPEKGEKLNAKKDFPKYKKHLEQKQQAVAAEEGVEINRTYTAALNGFSATLTSEQAVELAKDPNVRLVAPDVENAPDDYSSMDFLKLTGSKGAWKTQFGGEKNAGAGTVVGVIDTGYTPDNPFFAGKEVKPLKGKAKPRVGEPYLTGDGKIAMLKADGSTFIGECQAGEGFTGEECNSKVLAAQYFAEDFIEFVPEANRAPEELLSPVDVDSHGTHTASTAAGNSKVTQTVDGRDFGKSSGVAPAAKLSIYKTCWADDDPNTGGCYSSAAVAAINQAVLDGVDVLNYSISGSTTTTTDPVSLAFLSAASAGIFVATSAGNSGPTASTVNHGAPWLTTVAASTFSHALQGTAEFSDGSKFRGASIMNAEVPDSPVVLSADAAAAGGVDPDLCGPNSLDPALVAGKVVVCDRGVYDRVAKSAEVARAGGVGMILVNLVDSSTDTDKHSVPTVHVNAPEALALKEKVAANPDIQVSLVAEDTTGLPLPPVPQIAGFSSRGPLLATDSDLLKPDIAAPGVAVLAGVSPIGTGGDDFGFLSGTSMASPHIAGVGALILSKNPSWSPAAVKSAMMTTADPVKNAEGGVDGDVFATGAGQVDPASVLSPGLIYDAGVREYLQFVEGTGFADVANVDGIDAKDMNVPSYAVGNLTGKVTVTRTVTALTPGLYTATANVPGINVTVTPSVLNFSSAGETRTFQVTFENATAPLGAFAKGSLVWEGQGKTVASPVAVRPQSVVAPSEVSFTSEGPDGSGVIPVTSGTNAPVNLTLEGLSRANSEELSLVPGPVAVQNNPSNFVSRVEVPANTPFAKMSVLSSDDAADFDLFVFDPNGELYQVATASASETLNLENPVSGTYTAIVNLYSSPEGRATAATFDAAILGADEGNASLSPNPLVLANGSDGEVTLSWTGLEPGSYVGRVTYEGSTSVTFVSVVVNAAGESTVTAAPEANEADKLPSGPSGAPAPGNGK
ncbi:S8 family serine peptidase [Arthrobacter sp. JZ12]|uniref:S8 family peptidase n=1 Tax=Arthrobacter sp. JZ12 TaxID=2654190 RepID=UPI002B46FFFE|nr:S8 family peptidase [Arthrobacter sp. JZ12]WRH26324.1 S8 family serine peptidase [Arthrobacter sp. JZ12]